MPKGYTHAFHYLYNKRFNNTKLFTLDETRHKRIIRCCVLAVTVRPSGISNVLKHLPPPRGSDRQGPFMFVWESPHDDEYINIDVSQTCICLQLEFVHACWSSSLQNYTCSSQPQHSTLPTRPNSRLNPSSNSPFSSSLSAHVPFWPSVFGARPDLGVHSPVTINNPCSDNPCEV